LLSRKLYKVTKGRAMKRVSKLSEDVKTGVAVEDHKKRKVVLGKPQYTKQGDLRQ